MPQPAKPHDLEKVFVGANGAANVALKWQRPQSGTPAYYRVEVATSPFFVADGKVIERDQLVATEFGASDLRPGVYFWRVRATAASGQASDWSDPLKFIVATRGTGSQVAVSDLSTELLGGNIYLVRGKAEPGTTIRVQRSRNDRRARRCIPDSGHSCAAATREIMLEAQDSQGNSSQYKVSLVRTRADAAVNLSQSMSSHVILLTDAHEAPAYELIEALRAAGVKTLIEGLA